MIDQQSSTFLLLLPLLMTESQTTTNSCNNTDYSCTLTDSISIDGVINSTTDSCDVYNMNWMEELLPRRYKHRSDETNRRKYKYTYNLPLLHRIRSQKKVKDAHRERGERIQLYRLPQWWRERVQNLSSLPVHKRVVEIIKYVHSAKLTARFVYDILTRITICVEEIGSILPDEAIGGGEEEEEESNITLIYQYSNAFHFVWKYFLRLRDCEHCKEMLLQSFAILLVTWRKILTHCPSAIDVVCYTNFDMKTLEMESEAVATSAFVSQYLDLWSCLIESKKSQVQERSEKKENEDINVVGDDGDIEYKENTNDLALTKENRETINNIEQNEENKTFSYDLSIDWGNWSHDKSTQPFSLSILPITMTTVTTTTLEEKVLWTPMQIELLRALCIFLEIALDSEVFMERIHQKQKLVFRWIQETLYLHFDGFSEMPLELFYNCLDTWYMMIQHFETSQEFWEKMFPFLVRIRDEFGVTVKHHKPRTYLERHPFSKFLNACKSDPVETKQPKDSNNTTTNNFYHHNINLYNNSKNKNKNNNNNNNNKNNNNKKKSNDEDLENLEYLCGCIEQVCILSFIVVLKSMEVDFALSLFQMHMTDKTWEAIFWYAKNRGETAWSYRSEQIHRNLTLNACMFLFQLCEDRFVSSMDHQHWKLEVELSPQISQVIVHGLSNVRLHLNTTERIEPQQASYYRYIRILCSLFEQRLKNVDYEVQPKSVTGMSQFYVPDLVSLLSACCIWAQVCEKHTRSIQKTCIRIICGILEHANKNDLIQWSQPIPGIIQSFVRIWTNDLSSYQYPQWSMGSTDLVRCWIRCYNYLQEIQILAPVPQLDKSICEWVETFALV